jgi:Domain of unknown function (DUF4105)
VGDTMMQLPLSGERRSGSVGARLLWMLLFLPCSLWGVGALYYGSWPKVVCVSLALFYAVAQLAVVCLAPWRRVLAGSLLLFLLPLFAFHLMRPSNERPWQPDVAQPPYAEIDGDQVTVYNVRNCVYQSETNYTVALETRHYNLSELRTVDLYMVDWGLHKVVHTMVSFGFSDGHYLCFSIETRKEIGESYSAIKGLFRQYEVIFVAADERDLVGVRTTYRQGETVRLYRLVKAPVSAIRATFVDYLAKLNRLKQKPEWYNAVTGNCMIGFFQIARHHSAKGGWHWSIILNGYIDKFAYDDHSFDTSLPFETFRERSIINPHAQKASYSPDFSARIREGVPGMGAQGKGGL